MRRGDLIRAFGNNAAILHDNGTERPAPIRMDVLDGELNGTRHERLIHVVALAKWGSAVWAPENCELARFSQHWLLRSRFAASEYKAGNQSWYNVLWKLDGVKIALNQSGFTSGGKY